MESQESISTDINIVSSRPQLVRLFGRCIFTMRKAAISFIIYQDARGVTLPELPVNKATKSFDSAV